MFGSAVAIARYTVLEAIRTGLPKLCLALVVVGLGFAWFLQQVAITDVRSIRATILAAQLRSSGILVLAVFVIVSQVRESNDKCTEFLLSFALPRWVYYAGKLSGYACCATALALVFTLPVLSCATPGAALAWGFSLWCEFALVAAASLFCVLTLNQITPALVLFAGFYLLARALPALQLVASSRMAADNAGSTRWMAHVLDAVAYVMPRLDLFTRTAWLPDTAPGLTELAHIAGQAVVYVSLLAGASLFDLYRRNL